MPFKFFSNKNIINNLKLLGNRLALRKTMFYVQGYDNKLFTNKMFDKYSMATNSKDSEEKQSMTLQKLLQDKNKHFFEVE